MYSGPHIERDGLVFGYDTGYGIADNNTATRFYPGEPTTNLIINPTFINDTLTGWTSTGNTSVSNGIATLTGAGPNTSLYIFQDFTFGTSTVILSYEARTVNASDESGYGDSGARIRFDAFRVNSILASNTKWTKYTHTISHDGSARLEFSGHDLTAGSTFEIRNIQLEQKSHATPFTAGTRSVSDSLIDLTKSTNIDVSNVSFDSTGQPTFDGTDDRINGTWPSNLNVDDNTTPRSWEVVFNSSNTGGRRGIFGHKISSGCSYYCNGGIIIWEGNIAFNWYDNSAYRFLGSTTVSSNKYYHVVATFDTDRKPRVYVNGVLTNTYGSATNLDYSGGMGIYDIGWNSKDGGQHYFTGTIPVVKFYKNKALSSQEVQQNYNAYKNRFNI